VKITTRDRIIFIIGMTMMTIGTLLRLAAPAGARQGCDCPAKPTHKKETPSINTEGPSLVESDDSTIIR